MGSDVSLWLHRLIYEIPTISNCLWDWELMGVCCLLKCRNVCFTLCLRVEAMGSQDSHIGRESSVLSALWKWEKIREYKMIWGLYLLFMCVVVNGKWSVLTQTRKALNNRCFCHPPIYTHSYSASMGNNLGLSILTNDISACRMRQTGIELPTFWLEDNLLYPAESHVITDTPPSCHPGDAQFSPL